MSLVNIQPAESDRVIRVFPARNKWTPDDDLAFFREPGLFRPGTPETPVMVSCTFTWQRARAEYLARAWSEHYRHVSLGGPAFGDPGGLFVPGRFMKNGCTITSRGCPKNCGWCDVHRREGELRLLPIVPGHIVQDNNLLACPEHHLRAVFDMLRALDRAAFFNGGLDKHFLKPWHRDLFDSIKIGELWFACDQQVDLPALERIMSILDGIPRRKLRCYTMIGYAGETVYQAERRIEKVFELGFMPFCQLHQPEETKVYSDEWRKVRAKWARPAAYMSEIATFTSSSWGSPSDCEVDA